MSSSCISVIVEFFVSYCKIIIKQDLTVFFPCMAFLTSKLNLHYRRPYSKDVVVFMVLKLFDIFLTVC